VRSSQRRRLRCHLLVALLAAVLAPHATAKARIGVAGPAQGPGATLTRDIARAVSLAAKRINADGGVHGEPIEVVEADDGCAPGAAEAAAQALVAKGANLIVGHPCASAAIAAAKVYAQSGTLFLAPATRHPALTAPRAGPTIFRLAGRDDRQGASAGAYLARAFAGKPVAVVHDTTRYGAVLADGAVAALKEAGRADVLTATIADGQKDYGTLVAKLAGAHTQGLFFAGFPIEGGLLLRQMRAAGLATVFLGSDALAPSQFAETADEDATGAGVLLPSDAAYGAAAKVAETFPEQTPTGAFVAAYAAVEAWRAAVATAGSLEPAAVGAALQKGNLDTVLGPLSFDADGDADVPSYDILWWADGGWRRKN
jgi:branched-chain amino acid transport system substrate-binding protein